MSKKKTLDTIKNGAPHYWVSTVWLGLDHGFMPEADPIFETMVFDISKRAHRHGRQWRDLDCRRYQTELDAIAGHAEVVEEWENK